MWKCHVDEYTEVRCDMILGKDLFNTSGLDLNFSDHVIVGSKVPYESCLAPMVDVGNCDYDYLTDKIIKLE